MAVVDLTNEPQEVLTGNDNVVIVDNFQSVRGGRTLDVTGFTPEVIRAGHVIIRGTTGDKDYKPAPVTKDGAIATLGAITGGTGYANGTYSAVALSGGRGSGAIADVVVSGGAVTSVTLVSGGGGYGAADVLTAAIPGGSGFSVPVATVSAAAYTALPADHVYAGILIASIPTKKPFAGILIRGTVNPAAAPYPMDGILAAVKSALPLIDFRED
jgi:hypothetical protein